jgi:hypothetical protein
MTAFSQAMFVLAASLLAVSVAGDAITSKLQVHVSAAVEKGMRSTAVRRYCIIIPP